MVRLSHFWSLLFLAGTGCKPIDLTVLFFSEPGTYPGHLLNPPLDTPIALGGLVDVEVVDAGHVVQWSVESGDAITLEEEGRVAGVRAVAEGTADLRATLHDGSTDIQPLTVKPLGSTVQHPVGSLCGIFAGASSDSAGVVLRPGVTIPIGTDLLDADGNVMIGHDFLQWNTDSTLLSMEPATAPNEWNTVYITSLGIAGETSLDVTGGGALPIGLQDGTESNELTAVVPCALMEDAGGTTGDPIDELVRPAGTVFIGLMTTDASGRIVVGNSVDADALIVTADPPTLVLGSSYEPLNSVLLLDTCVGTGTITIQYMGGNSSLPADFSTPDTTNTRCP